MSGGTALVVIGMAALCAAGGVLLCKYLPRSEAEQRMGGPRRGLLPKQRSDSSVDGMLASDQARYEQLQARMAEQAEATTVALEAQQALALAAAAEVAQLKAFCEASAKATAAAQADSLAGAAEILQLRQKLARKEAELASARDAHVAAEEAAGGGV